MKLSEFGLTLKIHPVSVRKRATPGRFIGEKEVIRGTSYKGIARPKTSKGDDTAVQRLAAAGNRQHLSGGGAEGESGDSSAQGCLTGMRELAQGPQRRCSCCQRRLEAEREKYPGFFFPPPSMAFHWWNPASSLLLREQLPKGGCRAGKGHRMDLSCNRQRRAEGPLLESQLSPRCCMAT